MQSRGARFKTKARKIVTCLMAIMMLSLLMTAQSGISSASSTPNQSPPATQLEVKVGYPGGTYTHVKTFQRGDLERMPQVQQVYTFIDNMPCPVIDPAVGISLSDVLTSAGVDVNTVQGITAYSTDGYQENYAKSFLFNTPRYYFPHIADNWESVNGRVYFPDPAAAMADPVPVPTIIAIEDNWQRAFSGNVDSYGNPVDPGFGNLTDAVRYRLVFGETNPPVVTANLSAKWIYEMDVTLNGTAVTGVSLNKTSDIVAVGATDQLTATITPTGATNKNVTWSSGNTAVATVDSTGKVTGVAAGTANITVTTADGGKTATCAVVVSSSTGAATGGGVTGASNVSLTAPTSGQAYYPGDKVTISGTAQNLTTLSITVTDPGGKTIYTGNNLAVSSGSFTTSFTLIANAATGVYSIRISGTGLTTAYTTSFTVNAGSPSPIPTPGSPNLTASSGEELGFSDLNNHWAQKQIGDLVARGVIKGMTATEFMPDAGTTRAQFTTMLVGALKLRTQQEAGLAFKDIPVDAWYHDNVSTAVYAGLISGYNNGLFGPNDPITREQMVSMIARALLAQHKLTAPDQSTTATSLERFHDQDSISSWARTDIALVLQQGIINGRTDGTFAPQASATRAEAATMIWGLIAVL